MDGRSALAPQQHMLYSLRMTKKDPTGNLTQAADQWPKWKTTASKYIVNDRWLKLRADTCVTPDGHMLDPYYVSEYSDWITCLAIDQRGDVVMLKHYRYGADEYLFEVVAGMMEESDASPEATTKRELAEEIGYQGGTVFRTGVSYANPAIQTNKVHSFLAVGGECREQLLQAGENLHLQKMPFKEFLKRVETIGDEPISQSLHITAIFFALNFIRRSHALELAGLRRQLK